jgi:NAD(P)-dependent dehydrogenase (short-subunit alcohol dehydrogenase family)
MRGYIKMSTKTILVVGGAGGVGSAVVELLVNRGCSVVTTVLSPAEAALVQERHRGAVRSHIVDLSDSEAALVKLKEIVASLDHLNAVAICAASAPVGPVETTPLAVFRRTYEINCISEMAVYQAAMPALRETGGRIVLIGSMAGRAAFTFMSAYTATKFAIEGLADVMRREAVPQGVKISLIQPGGIRTNMVNQQIADVRREIDTLDEETRKLYSWLYEGYLKVSVGGLETGSTPEQVAGIVLEALEAEEPQSRYVAGEDAKQFFSLIRTMSGEEIDGLFNQMFLG